MPTYTQWHLKTSLTGQYSAPGELTSIGVLRTLVGRLYLSTNPLDMYECDAPVSKRTSAVNDLTKKLTDYCFGLLFNLLHVNVVHLSSVERVRLLPRAYISISILGFRTFIGVMSSLLAHVASDLAQVSLGWC